ncbi:unnamed protein product [Brachionus calyciflorus]|uniref:Palmitoyltransferase n=1 Tax=Brachionus calyciflorus TaxID=104777 RepID=A0A813NTV3_9BILA|nr:unnamed protein product [Brachionus calyciflorus]
MESLKKLIPTQRADRIGLGSALVLINLVTINDLITIYDELTKNSFKSICLFVIGIFILFNVLGNMFRAITTDTSIFSNQAPAIQLNEWRYCSICEQYAPPRSYHCLTCNKCILKRHNHCLFLGKCAGYKNLRFYLLFIFYILLGTLYSNFINYNIYLNALNNISFKTLLMVFVPWFALLIGLVSFKDFFFMFTNTITVILFLLMFFYFLINFKMIINGQTWYEKSKNVCQKQNRMSNFIETFGFNWKLAIIYPFASLKLSGDGTEFTQTNEINNMLNIKSV